MAYGGKPSDSYQDQKHPIVQPPKSKKWKRHAREERRSKLLDFGLILPTPGIRRTAISRLWLGLKKNER